MIRNSVVLVSLLLLCLASSTVFAGADQSLLQLSKSSESAAFFPYREFMRYYGTSARAVIPFLELHDVIVSEEDQACLFMEGLVTGDQVTSPEIAAATLSEYSAQYRIVAQKLSDISGVPVTHQEGDQTQTVDTLADILREGPVLVPLVLNIFKEKLYWVTITNFDPVSKKFKALNFLPGVEGDTEYSRSDLETTWAWTQEDLQKGKDFSGIESWRAVILRAVPRENVNLRKRAGVDSEDQNRKLFHESSN